jgi:hypothetical protein
MRHRRNRVLLGNRTHLLMGKNSCNRDALWEIPKTKRKRRIIAGNGSETGCGQVGEVTQ